jgi:hypothetical protein
MRALLTSTLAACAATALLAPAADAAPRAQLSIARTTGAIYQYDPSPFGGGPTYDTVNVTAQLRNCPAGDYLLDMKLVQNGVSYPLASTANGVGEFSCTTGNNHPAVSIAYYGNGLHPGAAQVTATVYREVDGMPVLAKSSRTVRIPVGPNNKP